MSLQLQVMREITAPYSALEAWVYDTLIAPAVVSMKDSLQRELLGLLPSGARVLDVGCGGGHGLVALATERPDLSLVGVDLSAGQVARAKRRVARFGTRVSVVEGSALELPFAEGSFDAVMSIASIKHWPDQPKGLSECLRVLRQGGQLGVVEADRGCTLDDARRFTEMWRLPGTMRAVAMPLFRTYVAGQGLDLDDARRLLAGLALESAEARRVEGAPALLMLGRKPG